MLPFAAPGAPRNVKVTFEPSDANRMKAHISWDAPEERRGVGVDKYNVELVEKDTGDNLGTVAVMGTSTEFGRLCSCIFFVFLSWAVIGCGYCCC